MRLKKRTGILRSRESQKKNKQMLLSRRVIMSMRDPIVNISSFEQHAMGEWHIYWRGAVIKFDIEF